MCHVIITFIIVNLLNINILLLLMLHTVKLQYKQSQASISRNDFYQYLWPVSETS